MVARAVAGNISGEATSPFDNILADAMRGVIDPVRSLCDAKTCPTVSPEDQVMYHDMNHLTPAYVQANVIFLDRAVLPADGKTLH
jgi:hypothetical protein